MTLGHRRISSNCRLIGTLGYGTRLIRELVPYELGGRVDLEFAAEGVSCRIEFPVEQI